MTAAALLVCAAGALVAAPASRHFDILIRNGEVLDGTGATRYRADVAINGDEIVAVGYMPEATR